MILDQRDGITIETFRGDREELHEMAVSSWRDEYGLSSFPDLYDPAFVDLVAGDVPPDHLVAAYDGDRCVSFVANLPRTVVLHGVERRACLAGLLTSRKQYLRRGIAEAMIRSALRLNETYHYDLALLYLETGHRSTRLIEKLRRDGHAIAPLKRLSVYGRVLDLAKVEASEKPRRWERALLRLLRAAAPPGAGEPAGLRPYRSDDLADCRRLLHRYTGRVDLARRFSEAELARLLDHPPLAHTLVVERGGQVEALVNWVFHRHVGAESARWAWINHVAFGELDRRDRRRLYAAFLRHAAAAGCAGAVEWAMGYHSVRPLLANRFFPYPRSVTLYAWSFSADLRPARVRTMFDMQV